MNAIDRARTIILARESEPFVVIYQGNDVAIQCTQRSAGIGEMWDVELSKTQSGWGENHPWEFLGNVTRTTALILVNHYLSDEVAA